MCYEHSYTNSYTNLCVDINIQFYCVNSQEQDNCIIWEVQVYLFKKFLHCFPKELCHFIYFKHQCIIIPVTTMVSIFYQTYNSIYMSLFYKLRKIAGICIKSLVIRSMRLEDQPRHFNYSFHILRKCGIKRKCFFSYTFY